jgi:hypothetical protein
MSAKLLLLAIAVPALATGCSSYGLATTESPAVPPFSAVADQAKVCVMRGGPAPAPFYTTVVYDNGKLVGATKDETYFCYLAQPGKHVIISDGAFGNRTALLTAEAGRRYYLKQTWLVPGFRGHALNWIDESVAQSELQDDEYAFLTEVPGTEALPGHQPYALAAP